jgi:hypothetical protein
MQFGSQEPMLLHAETYFKLSKNSGKCFHMNISMIYVRLYFFCKKTGIFGKSLILALTFIFLSSVHKKSIFYVVCEDVCLNLLL